MLNYQQPDERGHFGVYGGTFVAETLIHALDELKTAYDEARADPAFMAEFRYELAHYVGRPTPVYHAERLSRELGGAQIYLKREDLNHTGAHKINNCIGQILLAKRMGKRRIIAETVGVPTSLRLAPKTLDFVFGPQPMPPAASTGVSCAMSTTCGTSENVPMGPV